MLSNSDIKLIRSLKDRKARQECGMFVVEGEKLVQEAQNSAFTVEKIFRTEEIGEQAMSRISMLNTPSPVLALMRIPSESSLACPAKSGLYIGLDSLRDPGNMGTVLRIADWFGIDAVYASMDSVDIYNPKVVQSTMGALFRVNFHYCDLAGLISSSDMLVFGTFLEGENIYTADLSPDKGRSRMIVTGNEANGISAEIAGLCHRRLTIPSFASGQGSESLNAAVATAISVSEFKRRML